MRAAKCGSAAFLLALTCLLAHSVSSPVRAPALDAFFQELDANRDGSVDASEASKYVESSIGGSEFDSPSEAAEAARMIADTIDGGDAGSTVSVDELDLHLHNVLSGVRVWEWIRHGLVRAPDIGREGKPAEGEGGAGGCWCATAGPLCTCAAPAARATHVSLAAYAGLAAVRVALPRPPGRSLDASKSPAAAAAATNQRRQRAVCSGTFINHNPCPPTRHPPACPLSFPY